MKRYMGTMFILLLGLAIGIFVSSMMACSTSGSSGYYYGANVHYNSGWGHHHHRGYHRRPGRRHR